MKHLRSNAIDPGRLRLALAAVLPTAILSLGAGSVQAVPAFAVQTGQPCQGCHVGGFGPQLTVFGRNFKLHGYTQRSVDFNVPLSAMAVASYVKTEKPQAGPPAPNFNNNDNFGLDQISLFIAGGLGQHLGAFVQTTYDGIHRAWHWDNLDIRATTALTIRNADVLIGASLNNNPTVQDSWNTTPAWGYPYTNSSLAPAPASSPLINGAFAQNTLGLTAYAWINSEFYIEAGAYGSPGASTLVHLGVNPAAPGDIDGAAPYGRIAFQHQAGPGVLEIGGVGMYSEVHPGLDRTAGTTDRFTDLGADASYIWNRANGDVVTVQGRYVHEQQDLRATCILAGQLPGCANIELNDLRADASYYWRNKIGFTVAGFDTFGSANPVIYASNRTSKPNSNGVLLQVDGTPWGGEGSPLGPRFNMRVGVQYTVYTSFNGADSNFDGAGTNAGANNTFRVFTWIAY